MLHSRRVWTISQIESAEDLSEKLTQHILTGCTGLELQGYLFLNDSTSPDGAQEYAVLVPIANGRFEQIESITFSWCSQDRALELIGRIVSGGFDKAEYRHEVKPRLESAAEHGRCHLCA